MCEIEFFTGRIKFVVEILIYAQKYAFKSQKELRNISIHNFLIDQNNNGS